jgi:hypothetical protein
MHSELILIWEIVLIGFKCEGFPVIGRRFSALHGRKAVGEYSCLLAT